MAISTSPPPKSRRWWWLVLALLAVSLAGFAQVMNFSLRGQSSDSAADRGPGKFVVCYGYVDLETSVSKIHPTQPGSVADVLVHEGDFVAKNGALVHMRDDLPRVQAEQARLDLEDAKAKLADARIKAPEKHRLDLQNQAAAMALAKHRSVIAEINYRHKRDLVEKKSIGSPSEVAAAKEEFEAAQTLVAVEETKLQQLQLHDPQSEIRRLEMGVEKLAAIQKQAETVLAEYTLRAPGDGHVLRISVSPGDAVSPAAMRPAIEFGVNGPRIIRAEVEQAFAAPIVPGLSVTIED